MKTYREGYYWAIYKDFNIPHIVEIRFEKWDHTRDGNRWALWEGDTEIPEDEWFKYRFISYIEPPTWPYQEVSIELND